MSIIPRAKVKELPFAFAEDLKGGRAGRSAKKNTGEKKRDEEREKERVSDRAKLRGRVGRGKR